MSQQLLENGKEVSISNGNFVGFVLNSSVEDLRIGYKCPTKELTISGTVHMRTPNGVSVATKEINSYQGVRITWSEKIKARAEALLALVKEAFDERVQQIIIEFED